MKGLYKIMLGELKDVFPFSREQLPYFIAIGLEELLDEYAKEYGLCPECLGDLEEKSYKECMGEEMGVKQYEEFYFKRCTSCGREEAR